MRKELSSAVPFVRSICKELSKEELSPIDEDLTQEVFVRFLENIKRHPQYIERFLPPEGGGTYRLQSYLYVVAKTVFIDYLRKKERDPLRRRDEKYDEELEKATTEGKIERRYLPSILEIVSDAGTQVDGIISKISLEESLKERLTDELFKREILQLRYEELQELIIATEMTPTLLEPLLLLLQGYSADEIQKRLGVSSRDVIDKRLQRAREKLFESARIKGIVKS